MASKREPEREHNGGAEAEAPGATERDENAAAQPADAATATEELDVEARLAELSAELERAQDRHLRLAADFENYKKRARQEHLETIQYANAKLAERLLPIVDDAERALEHVPEGVDENWLKGVRLTLQKLEDTLASVGVERIKAVGTPFDPQHHEAIGFEESADHPDDTVVVELRPGYRMHDRVLRPSLVKVSRNQG